MLRAVRGGRRVRRGAGPGALPWREDSMRCLWVSRRCADTLKLPIFRARGGSDFPLHFCDRDRASFRKDLFRRRTIGDLRIPRLIFTSGAWPGGRFLVAAYVEAAEIASTAPCPAVRRPCFDLLQAPCFRSSERITEITAWVLPRSPGCAQVGESCLRTPGRFLMVAVESTVSVTGRSECGKSGVAVR